MFRKEKDIEHIFLLFYFILLCIWCISIPISGVNMGPDEQMKMDVCNYLVKYGKIPHGGNPEIRNEIWGISYAFMPILSYMLSAFFMKITMLFTQNATALFVAARFTSVLCATGMAYIVFKIGHKLFENRRHRWCFVMACALLPQMVYLGSYLNNDSFALLSIALIVYAWIIGLESKWNKKSVILLGVSIGVCALSYYNAYGYILTSVFLYVISYFCENGKVCWKKFFQRGIAIALIAISIAGWWFVRNAVIYDGDFLGMKTESEYAESYALDEYKPSQINNSNNMGESLGNMLVKRGWIKSTAISFTGIYGSCSVVNLCRMYFLYLFSIVAALVFRLLQCGRASFRQNEIRNKKRILLELTFCVNMIIPVVLSLYYSYFSDYQPQGRYLMPMLIPLMYHVTKGGCGAVDAVAANERLRKVIYSLIYILMLMGPVVCLMLVEKYIY